MSFSSEYENLRKKRKEEEKAASTGVTTSNASGGSFSSQYEALREDRLKNEQAKVDNDLGPVRQTTVDTLNKKLSAKEKRLDESFGATKSNYYQALSALTSNLQKSGGKLSSISEVSKDKLGIPFTQYAEMMNYSSDLSDADRRAIYNLNQERVAAIDKEIKALEEKAAKNYTKDSVVDAFTAYTKDELDNGTFGRSSKAASKEELSEYTLSEEERNNLKLLRETRNALVSANETYAKYGNVASLSEEEVEKLIEKADKEANAEDFQYYTSLKNGKSFEKIVNKLSDTKMDGSDKSVYDEVKDVAQLENGKEKDAKVEKLKKGFAKAGVDFDTYYYAITGEDKGVDLLDSGAFSDGYDFGDVTKTILGTTGDAVTGFLGGVSSTIEGVADLGGYLTSNILDAVGADELAGRAKINSLKSATDTMFGDAKESLNKYSLLGDSANALTEGLGQIGVMYATQGLGNAAGLSASATSAVTMGSIGASAAGSGMGEAYWSGATDKEALAYGVLTGTTETLSEMLFQGLGKGLKLKGFSEADDVLAKKVSSVFKSPKVQNAVQFAIKSGAEGVEELVAGYGNAVAKKLTYMSDKELSELIEDENLFESFVIATLTSSIAQGKDLYTANKSGTDFITGEKFQKLTDTEQMVIDKVYEAELAEREKEGNKLTEKQKTELRDSIIRQMDKGQISIDTIEEVLGGDTYKALTDLTAREEADLKELSEHYEGEELKKRVDAYLAESQKGDLQTQLADEVYNLVYESRLSESYNERVRSGLQYNVDEETLAKYGSKYRATIQRAMESGVLNNTRRSHELVELVAKLEAEKGTTFDFTNNEKLAEAGFTVEGKTINGLVGADGVKINVDSNKYLNTVVGHEITHVLEGTELYQAFQEAVFEYAKAKGEYDSRFKEIDALYSSVEGYQAKGLEGIKKELAAELAGDYLFTDPEFVKNLSVKNRNLFQKIFDEIKYLCKVATAGSKEARALEKAKKTFEDAYRAETIKSSDSDTTKIRYSIGEESRVFYTPLGVEVVKNPTNSEYRQMREEIYKSYPHLRGTGEPVLRHTYDEQGNEYYWNAYEGMHSSVEPYINKKYNTRTSQQWEWWTREDKDDFPTDYDNTRYSLSKNGATQKRYGDLNITGEDVRLQGVEDAPVAETPRVSMEEFANNESPVWRNVGYNDDSAKTEIMRATHKSMVDEGAVVTVSEDVTKSVDESFPDLRGMKKKDRTPILKESMRKLKENLRQFLNGFKNQGFEFEVNGKVLDAKLYNTGINEVLEKISQDKASMLYTTEEIFRNARYLYSTEDYDSDPNVYRWNYFYTPVQIGDSVVGVRIAVRDTVNPSGSQIYNWGIKKDTSLDGGGRGTNNRSSTGVSSDVSNNIIPQNGSFVNPQDGVVSNVESGLSTEEMSAKADALFEEWKALRSVKNRTEAQNLRLSELAEQIDALDKAAKNPANATKTGDVLADDIAPLNVEEQSAMDRERLASLTDSDMPPIPEAPYYEAPTRTGTPSNPFTGRDYDEIGKRGTKSFMEENPETIPYFQEAAQEMLGDLQNSIKGERYTINDADGYIVGWDGTKRNTTDDIADLLDGRYHYTYKEISDALNAIINGEKLNACAKRIEFALNDRLMNGYTNVDGMPIPANQEYIDLMRFRQETDEAYKQYMDSVEYLDDSFTPVAEVETPAPVESVKKPVGDISPVKQPDNVPYTTGTQLKLDPSGEKVANVLTEEPKTAAEERSTWQAFMRNFVDKKSVFEKLSLEKGNRELQARADALHRADSSAQYLMKNGDKAAGVKSLEEIRKTVQESGKEQAFSEYVYHVHNIDRMSLESRVAPKIAEYQQTFKGMSDEQIQALSEQFVKRNTPEDEAARIRAAREYVRLQGFRDKPVFGDSVTADVSREKVAEFEQNNPEFKGWAQDLYKYTNHLRNMMVEEGIISQETADLWQSLYPHYVPIRRDGKEGAAINVALDTNKTGVNAPIKRATGGNADILPLFDTLGTRTVQTFNAIAKNRFGVELKNTLKSTVTKSKPSFKDAINSVENHEGLLKEGNDGMMPTFTVFENGERVEFEITEDMFDAMKPTSEFLSKKVLKGIPNKISNFRRGVLTEYNPYFMLTNAAKDVQDILVNSQHAAKTYANLPVAINEIRKNGKYYQEYLANGGDQISYFERETNTFEKEKSTLRKYAGFPLDMIAKANNFVERLPRLAEYIASRKAGRSIDVSMLDAARVTTNFAAGGDVTKFLNRNGFTFLNASVQGAAQQVRNIREAKHKGLKGWLGLAAKYTIAGLPAMLLNGLLWQDDEDYEGLSDYVKRDYYIVGKNDDGTFIRIPKGRTLSVIQNGLHQMQNLITGDDEVDFGQFFELVMNNLAPNNPIDNNIISPIAQAWSNTTWYGEDLVPSRLQDLPAGEQFDESTDAFSKWLGENTGISPYKINYLLDQYSGVVGDAVLPILTPDAERGDGNVFTSPFLDKFTTDPVMKNQNVSDFYTKKDEVTANANSSKATDDDILKSKYFNSISSDLNELYAQKREIQNDTTLSDEEKYAEVRALQQQIVDLTRDAMDSYKDIEIDDYYARVGNRHYRLDNGTWTKISDTQLERMNEVTSKLGISPSEYWSKTEISFMPKSDGEYEYAYKSPEKYEIAKVVGYDAFREHSTALNKIPADKDANGKSISGSRKEKVQDYINGLDLDYGDKIILFKSQYPADDTYNYDIIDYLNGREDISYSEMETILKELGFTVHSDGRISW